MAGAVEPRASVARLIALGLALAPCCAAAQTLDQLYAAAKAEKTLVLWGAGPTAGYEAAAKAFEQQYPGISVSLKGGFSNVLNAQVEQQVSARKIETDVLIFQTVQDFVGWNKRGLLMHFKPDGFDTIGAGYKDPDGAWIAVNAYPADDDATLYDFYTIVSKYGWGYMDKYMAQQPKLIQGHLGVARSIGSGESYATFDNTIGSTNTAKREGGKIGLAAPADDPMPVFFTSETILKEAPHPNAAKLFINWFLSSEQQGRTGVYSARSDVPPPAGLKPLSSYRLAADYLKFVTDEAQLVDLRKRFEGYTGPVTNAGGVK
jgi:ABC-type Fe3+ transport system substrate-binding protein